MAGVGFDVPVMLPLEITAAYSMCSLRHISEAYEKKAYVKGTETL